jgi:hypothetical protein
VGRVQLRQARGAWDARPRWPCAPRGYLQLELFELALDEVGDGDLVNQVLEITIDEQTEIRVLRYALPPD